MKNKFAIIGLGQFGMAIAKTLSKKGAEVIAIDKDINKIEQGASIDEIVKNIWPYEQKEITRMALNKFSIKMIEMYISMFIRLDMQSKNLVKGDTWLSLKDLCIAISKNKLSILKLN